MKDKCKSIRSKEYLISVLLVVLLAMGIGFWSTTAMTDTVNDVKVAETESQVGSLFGSGESLYDATRDTTYDTYTQDVVSTGVDASGTEDKDVDATSVSDIVGTYESVSKSLTKYDDSLQPSSYDISLTSEGTVENPLYSAYRTTDYTDSIISYTIESEVLATASQQDLSAVESIRAAMEARQTEFTIAYETDSAITADDIDALFLLALEDTGVPTQGDSLYWVWNTCSFSATGSTDGTTYCYDITYFITYYTDASEEAVLSDTVASIIDSFGFTDSTSDYEKIQTIYDYVSGHVSYDYDGLNDDSDQLKYTAYGALVEGSSVCQGYAVAMYRLLLEVGVPVRVIGGTSSGENHAWNIVKVNGCYYNLDATWESTNTSGTYKYFLRCNDNFTNHTRWDDYTTDEFNAKYNMATTDYDASYVDDSQTVATIDDTNFPDAIFLAYVQENCDLDEDGTLSEDEVAKVTYMDVSSMSITTLEGVEYLTDLKRLICSDNMLTSLDLSKNTDLTYLECDGNSYATELTDYQVYDLTGLSSTFDVSMTSGWSGATVSDTTLAVSSATVTYTYDCGGGYSADFTLVFTDYHEHTTELQNAKEATTTEEGYTGDEVCTICGEVITTGEVIPMLEEDEPSSGSGTEADDTGSDDTVTGDDKSSDDTTDDGTGSNNTTSNNNSNASNNTETSNEEAEEDNTSTDEVTPATTIAKVKKLSVKKKGKKLIITYKVVSGAAGYRIQIATNRKFTKGKKIKLTKKTKYKTKKLKKNKKYYIRVQAYKVVDGVKKYGKWSIVKKIKLA